MDENISWQNSKNSRKKQAIYVVARQHLERAKGLDGEIWSVYDHISCVIRHHMEEAIDRSPRHTTYRWEIPIQKLNPSRVISKNLLDKYQQY